MKFPTQILTAAAFALFAGAGIAAPIDSSTTGLAAPSTTITFNELTLSDGASVTDQFAAKGVSFSPRLTYLNSVSLRPNFSGAALVNFGGQPFATFDPFSILFANLVSEAVFAYTTNGGSTRFESLLNGALVESFTSATNVSAQNFYGFSGSLFDEIRVTSVTAPRTGALDNLSFTTAVAAVPVPAALPLMIAGLAMLGVMRRRGL